MFAPPPRSLTLVAALFLSALAVGTTLGTWKVQADCSMHDGKCRCTSGSGCCSLRVDEYSCTVEQRCQTEYCGQSGGIGCGTTQPGWTETCVPNIGMCTVSLCPCAGYC